MLLLTCFSGTVGVLNNELKKLGYTPRDTFDAGTFVERSDFDTIYDLNLRSRIANKIYLKGGSGQVRTFDQLFALMHTIQWSHYISTQHSVSINVITQHSILHAYRSIQSVAHKAILTQLGRSRRHTAHSGQRQIDILLQIDHNQATVRINTSGASLHQRGYRVAQGQAPLKETLAATLIQLSGWRFKFPLVDPCRGSGTIPIEAAMIARNIAPGLYRDFAFQGFAQYDEARFQQKKTDVQGQVYQGSYDIVGYDRDPTMIALAKENAKRAGVGDIVRFVQQDAKDFSCMENGYLVTNPPYGSRISTQEGLEQLYALLVKYFQQGMRGCMITSWKGEVLDAPVFDQIKELNNNGEECRVYGKR